MMPEADPLVVDTRLQEYLADYPAEIFPGGLYRSIELLEQYSQDLAVRLLQELGVMEALDSPQPSQALVERLGYTPRFENALSWLLERLVETGAIKKEEATAQACYSLQQNPHQPDLESLRASLLAIDANNAATLDLMDRAAEVYPAIARGEMTGEAALFGASEINLWLDYFNNSNPTYAINNYLAAHAIAERLASKSTLRILELGAGAGSAAEALLNVLTSRGMANRVEQYVISEPNMFFRRRAERHLKKQFKQWPLSFSGLDIDKDWREQGLADDSFDLIFGVNVFHVSHDLLFSLEQARACLAPEGWLVAGECLRPTAQPIFPEFMFQILDGFNDIKLQSGLRPNPGFLTADQWRQNFTRAGFQHVELAPDVEQIHGLYPCFFTGAVCGC